VTRRLTPSPGPGRQSPFRALHSGSGRRARDRHRRRASRARATAEHCNLSALPRGCRWAVPMAGHTGPFRLFAPTAADRPPGLYSFITGAPRFRVGFDGAVDFRASPSFFFARCGNLVTSEVLSGIPLRQLAESSPVSTDSTGARF
jgi:hypothetical protein